MMGSYYYYDTSYIVDHVPAELHTHDCMWSGECYSCQPAARLTFSGVPPQCPMVQMPRSRSRSLSPTPRHQLPSRSQSVVVTSASCPVATTSASVAAPVVAEVPPRRREKLSSSNGRNKSRKANNNNTNKNGFSSTDNKKLRHREVEKNRHRQLQAMVKTLSERIPGRLDKETQVQTMKRAARYFIYLRDVMGTLTQGNLEIISEDKFEKLYIRACDNVELIMSQNIMSTGRGGDSNWMARLVPSGVFGLDRVVQLWMMVEVIWGGWKGNERVIWLC